MAREPLAAHEDRFARQQRQLGLLAEATKKNARPQFEAEQTAALVRFFLAEARRTTVSRPDLAALLYYRCLELALQRRLATHDIDAGKIEVNDPEVLVERFNKVVEERYQIQALPTEVAASGAFFLLLALEDEVIVGTELSPKAFTGILQGRNKSVFAHGYSRLSDKDLAKFRKHVLQYICPTTKLDGYVIDPEEDPEFDFFGFG